MAMYKKGDRVKVRSWESMKSEYGVDSSGAIMIPCNFMPEMRKYCGRTVIIEDVISGSRHDSYHIKGGEGWSFSSQMFVAPEVPKTSETPKTLKVPKSHKPIVIYQEGRKVIAQDTQTGKTGVARCHPNDKFDFFYGAGLAIERLTGYKSEAESTVTPEPEYYSGKVVCIKSCGSFTVGKVYTIKNGFLYVDDHYCCDSIPNVAWLNRNFDSKFIELIE